LRCSLRRSGRSVPGRGPAVNRRITVAAVAVALDLAFGELRYRYHPVAWVGRGIDTADRRLPQGDDHATELVAYADAPLVHPHACGDHWRRGMAWSDVYGSPPRVWGPLGADQYAVRRWRFTPTRVG